MKRIKWLALALIVALTSCDKGAGTYERYIVTGTFYKEGGMCHSNRNEYLHKIIVIVPHTTHHHTYQQPEYKVYISNKDGVEVLNVTVEEFKKFMVYNIVKYNKTSNRYIVYSTTLKWN